MTLPESKSIEEKLIKISVRTLWVIVASVVLAVWVSAGFYSELKLTQERILNEVMKARLDFNYQIKDIQKDLHNQESRIQSLEKGSE
jgi:peptidoglycan hydrolase CwlO-like protein